jgi:hypothetical protein
MMSKKKSDTPKKKKLSPRKQKFLELRQKGVDFRAAYVLAGFKGDPKGSAPSWVNSEIKEYLITREDMLILGRAAAEKAFEDYLTGEKSAHVPGVLRLIEMQQDRIDPKIHKEEHRHFIGIFAPEDLDRLEADYNHRLKKWRRPGIEESHESPPADAEVIEGTAVVVDEHES